MPHWWSRVAQSSSKGGGNRNPFLLAGEQLDELRMNAPSMKLQVERYKHEGRWPQLLAQHIDADRHYAMANSRHLSVKSMGNILFFSKGSWVDRLSFPGRF